MQDIICNYVEKFVGEVETLDEIRKGLADLGFEVTAGKGGMHTNIDPSDLDLDDDEADRYIMLQVYHLARDGKRADLHLFFGNQTEELFDYDLRDCE